MKILITSAFLFLLPAEVVACPYAGNSYVAREYGLSRQFSFPTDCTEVIATMFGETTEIPLQKRGKHWTVSGQGARLTFKENGKSASISVRGQNYRLRLKPVK